MTQALSGYSSLTNEEKHGIGDFIQNVPMGQIDLNSIKHSDLVSLQRLLTPKMTKYTPHVPTAKQSAFLLLNCKEAFYGGAAGGGKALALDTPILTKTGWKQFGDLTLEDKVLAIDGTWTGLEYVTEVQENHVCYAVTFSNGECIIADEEHLWLCSEYKNRKYWQDIIKTTKNLQVKDKLVKADGLQGEYLDVDIDPYIFGYWLGDGNARTGSITVCNEDKESLERFCTLHVYESMSMQYTVDGLTTQLHKLGVLRNKVDNRQTAPETKHIPVSFFSSSFEQRLSLLQGLMDSDGSIQERGRCEIGLTETRLANDVCTLLSSLGFVYSHTIVNTKYKGKYCPSHRITFSTILPVFRLPRKLQKIPTKVLQNKITIKSIKKVPSVPVRCIRIAHSSHTFLVGKTLLPTHNSDALLMCGLQYVNVKGYAGIIFRKTYADLVKPGALIDRAKDWLLRFEEVRWNEKDKKFEFYTDKSKKELISILQFGYLENANDRYNYQGGEYQFIGFDELTHIDYTSYKYMFSRLRRLKGTNIPLRVRGASNPPDDDSGIWVKQRFIDEGPDVGRVFIPAGLDDNPYLDTEEYEKSLEELDPVTRARLRDGNWEIVRKGNMFKKTWFQAVDELPPLRRKCRWWDMAATDEDKAKRKNKSNDPDYTVGFLLSEYNGIFYIEDIIRERLSPEKTQSVQEATARADGYNTMVREEQEPGSSGITLCDIKARTIFMGYAYEAIKSSGDKATRAAAASAAAERGQIKYIRGCRNIEEFFGEAESFPGGIHDDMVDGLSGAFTTLCVPNVPGVPLVVLKPEEQENLTDFVDFEPGYFSRFGR